MKRVVISLGGSIIIPDKVNINFLEKFRFLLQKQSKSRRFVVVCGGGSVARTYITALEAEGESRKERALAGMRVTRMNALLVMQFFGKEANDILPRTMKEVRDYLRKNNIVLCGALRYEKNATSDTTAARLAHYFNAEFINMTNVLGLYTDNPKKNKNATLIKKISWGEFAVMASKIHYKPGQHFILDTNAAETIKRYRIKSYIIGPNLDNLEKLLEGKRFKGTTIS